MNKDNNKKVTIYLMRHGETILNKAGKTQGWCDSVLTKEGLDDVISTGIGLSNIKFEAVYSSDLGRAVKTAEVVIEENNSSENLQLIKCEDLREMYFGKYEGGMDSDFHRELAQYLKVTSIEDLYERLDCQREFCDACASLDETKEAENYDTLLKRTTSCFEKICKENYKKAPCNILIVAHGGILRILLEHYSKDFIDLKNIDNASISKIEYGKGKFKIISINDTSYTEQGKDIRMI